MTDIPKVNRFRAELKEYEEIAQQVKPIFRSL
jgi:hypothetical protein